jgi:ABC-type glycerol-3-phosphate transport system permease component
MNNIQRIVLLCFFGFGFAFAFVVHGFTTPHASLQKHASFSAMTSNVNSPSFYYQPTSSLKATPLSDFALDTTSISLSATTLDPSTFLSNVLGGFINSNLILAVPIVAALAIASLVAFAIVSYANPAEPEDD